MVERQLRSGGLHTVCEEAACPNRSECFCSGTATFLIMGETCTRGCRFCAVSSSVPRELDPEEPTRLAQAALALGLRHVVVTSVTRDDLDDGGAGHFASVIAALREQAPGVSIEVLVPDFSGSTQSVRTVLDAGPDVFNHNVETVPRLYPHVRPEANFARSLGVLKEAAHRGGERIVTKSGIMVGLGETEAELIETLGHLRSVDCAVVTIGQYLQPTRGHVPVARYVEPEEFERLRVEGDRLGFAKVIAGPFVRSSYGAGETYSEICRHGRA